MLRTLLIYDAPMVLHQSDDVIQRRDRTPLKTL